MAFQLPTGWRHHRHQPSRFRHRRFGLWRDAPGVPASARNITWLRPPAQRPVPHALSPAIQTIWSKEILFQAMPVLRFEQFAVKKTELGVMPGLTVNFMRYNNLPIPSGPLVEGIRMQTLAITAQQYRITVAEQGQGIAMSELLLNASFDDVLASSSRLLGRSMATYMDLEARSTIQSASSVVYGYSDHGPRPHHRPWHLQRRHAGRRHRPAHRQPGRRLLRSPRLRSRMRRPGAGDQEHPPPGRHLRLLHPPGAEPPAPGHPGVHRGHEVRRTGQLHAR
jgi:hypothetical protein